MKPGWQDALVGVPGSVTLAATPLGNPGDASIRLRQALSDAEVIAAEDTRRLRRLLDDLGIRTTARVLSYHDANERERSVELVQLALAGQQVLVVCDAGMPGISDPGYRIVQAAIAAGLPLQVVPGPSAVLTALTISGLPTDRFCFEGFLPRKAGERAHRIAQLVPESRTMVFFEAPHRVMATLQALAEGLGADRPAALCRELTKTYEEVRRGTLGELLDWAKSGVRGEITLVVAGFHGVAHVEDEQILMMVAELQQQGLDRREAITGAARQLGLPRRQVYAVVVANKGATNLT